MPDRGEERRDSIRPVRQTFPREKVSLVSKLLVCLKEKAGGRRNREKEEKEHRREGKRERKRREREMILIAQLRELFRGKRLF